MLRAFEEQYEHARYLGTLALNEITMAPDPTLMR
jgi:hypothetical protein